MHLAIFNSIKFKMATYRPLFTFTWPLFGNRARWLVHYYKTKCEISGEDASCNIQLYQTQNGHLSTIIHFHMAFIW